MRALKTVICTVIVLFICNSSLFASNAQELYDAYNDLQDISINVELTYDISNDTIRHHDFMMVLESGKIVFFDPIVIDSDSIVFGAYFKGEGQMIFEPSVLMEQDQLKRFFNTGTLKRHFKKTLLYFAPQIYDSLKTNLSLSKNKLKKKVIKEAKKLNDIIHEDTDFLYTFELLRNLQSPSGKPYFLSFIEPIKDDNLIYMFNPYLREEIRFWKQYWKPGNSFMELISSYSQYNKDESYTNINGRDKSQIDIKYYNINSSINRKGIMYGEAEVFADVLTGPFQMIEFNIIPTIQIDSIKDNNGLPVLFKREKLDVLFKDWESRQIALFLNQEMFYKDSLNLTFYYHGEIANKYLGEYFVYAGANWYPSYGYRDRATYNLTYKTDRQYTFTSCGNLLDKDTKGDTLITKWRVIPEAADVSFNIGNLKKFVFKDKDIVPTDVYFSKELHAGFGGRMGKDMEKQVAEDVMNSMKIFNYYFGDYPLPKLTVGEILASHGQAFPGFIHLGYTTWTYTDTWGYDRLFRAHEVAHQWWGVGVGYETYHDQWLSEGFAEYSALLYYQYISKNKKFFNKLKESRNKIFSVRKYLFSSGEESGPIALGTRTSGSETEGDYGLIIYEKGAFILHMLRNIMIDLKTMNEDNFFDMLKEFYGSYRGKDATTQDFKRIAEKYAGVSLDWFFDQWVYHNYLPEYEFSYEIVHNESTKLLDANCTIITKGVPEDFKMFLPLEIQLDETSKAYIRLFVDSHTYTFTIPNLSSRPKKIILNPFESVLAKVKQ